MVAATPSASLCRSCGRPLGPGLFCSYCGLFVLDPQGTTIMATRISRLGASLLNALLFILTLGIGWVIWWFIIAPRGQNPGKALVGLRVIRTDGRSMDTGWMFVRGLVGFLPGLLIGLWGLVDDAWLLWDQNAQTLHDKIASTVVVRAQGSEHMLHPDFAAQLPPGVVRPGAYAPPIAFTPPTAPASPAQSPADALHSLANLRDRGLLTDEEYEEKRKAMVDRL